AEAGHRKTLAHRQKGLIGILVGLGQPTEAEKACRRVLTLYEKMAGRFPDVPDWRDYQGETLHSLADVQVRLGDHAGAATSAAQLPRLGPDGWAAYRQAAGVLARCVHLAEQ